MTQKILWDFEIQTEHRVLARKRDLVLIGKKKVLFIEYIFFSPADHEMKKKKMKKEERKRKERQILGRCERAEKTVEHEGDGETNCSWYTRNYSQRLGKENRRIEDQKKKSRQSWSQLRILRRDLKTWRDLMSLRLQWETTDPNWFENFAKRKKNKWSNQNLENDKHRILWNFKLPRITQSRSGDKRKRICHEVDFVVKANCSSENEKRRKSGKISRLCQRTEKVVEHGSDGKTNHYRV